LEKGPEGESRIISQSAGKSGGTTFLEIVNVKRNFIVGRNSLWDRFLRRKPKLLRAVQDVTLSIKKGETLALLGESGSGKTTLGRLVSGLDRPDSGTIALNGQRIRYVREKGAVRGRVQMVFQDPGASLDPFMNTFNCIAEPLRKNNSLSKAERRQQVIEALDAVGMDESYADRKTSELSGGQKQRVAVARAIVGDPDVIVLDEPTSSIDVSIQAQILNLLYELQRDRGFTYLLITHDPNVARFLADSIAVMHLGRVVEYGPAPEVLLNPRDPYTIALLTSAPKLGKPSELPPPPNAKP
jgi:ABC-type oligopeptide transport system ATPase subunit